MLGSHPAPPVPAGCRRYRKRAGKVPASCRRYETRGQARLLRSAVFQTAGAGRETPCSPGVPAGESLPRANVGAGVTPGPARAGRMPALQKASRQDAGATKPGGRREAGATSKPPFPGPGRGPLRVVCGLHTNDRRPRLWRFTRNRGTWRGGVLNSTRVRCPSIQLSGRAASEEGYPPHSDCF
jgi:hypothetical protein